MLSPSKAFVERAFQRGGERSTFIFYGSRLLAPGVRQSKLRQVTSEVEIPNALIIPIRRGEQAQPGDIVLTHWQSGSGMQRAMVVKGGTPTEPAVRYLDITLDNPSGAGRKVDRCKPDTFHKLSRDGEVGAAVACKEGRRRKRYRVIHRAGEQLLGLGFAGRMKVLRQADCTSLPIRPEVAPGARVEVPHMGSMRPATVKKVEPEIGRVHVELTFGGRTELLAAPFGDVAVLP